MTGSTANLAWTASTDNVAVVRYNVHRGSSAGFTPSLANRIAQPTGTSYPDTGLATGSYFYKVTAEDAAGNTSAASNEAPATVADATPPSAPGTLTATAAGSTINLSWGAASDNVGVSRYNLHRGTTSGFTPTTANRIAQPTGLSHADTTLAPGTYFYKLTAEDAAGNIGPLSNTASATVADTTPPSTPTLNATGGAGQATLTWTAATDNVAVTRYNLHRSTTSGFTPTTANRIAQPTGTSHTDTGLTAGTYHYKLTAEDAAGNTSPASTQASATVTTPAPTGLVAAYGLDTGTGTTITDQSGTGNNGTTTNTTWAGSTAGRYGNALTFNGTNAVASIPDGPSLDLTTGMTVEAWVRPTALGNDYRTILMKERPGGSAYALYANGSGNDRAPIGETFIGTYRSAIGSTQLALNTWTHLATTYDGSVLALYVNGTQAAQLLVTGAVATSTSPLKLGGNAIWGEWFAGQIDEVRVYSRALTATEIQTDMNTAITNPDAIPPSAPGALSASGGLSSASLSWAAASDNVGVVRYNVHRGTSAGFTPSTANRVGQPTGLSFTDSVAAGSYFYRVTAEDAAGNVGPVSNEASATVGDTQRAVGAGHPGRGRVGREGDPVLGNRDRQRRRGALQRASGQLGRVHAHPGEPDRAADHERLRRQHEPRLLLLQGDRRGRGRQHRPRLERSRRDRDRGHDARRRRPTGLSAPVTGSTVNLTWTASTDNVAVVRYNVHRGSSAGFTPSLANRIAQPTGTSYPDTGLATGSYFYKVTAEDAAGNTSAASNEAPATVADATPPSAPGTLTATAAGSTINLSWGAASDNVGVSRYNLHRGTTSGFTPTTANRIAQPTGLSHADTTLAPGTHFYKLTAEDAAGNIGPLSNTASATVADTTPPSTPTLNATGGAGQATLTWTAATDNVAVTRYNLHRSTTSGFTPTTANRIAQPTGTSHTDTGLTAGTYHYKLTAEDAAGNTSPASNQASATVTTPAPTGLVGAWAFDESSGTTAVDQSGRGNPGTISNATRVTTGRFNSALLFNGSNAWVTVADAATLDLTTGMTLEAWVRPSVAGGWRTVVAKDQPGTLNYGLYANASGSFPGAEVFVGGATRSLDGSTALPVGTWSHAATTYDGTMLRLYVNGAQVSQQVLSGSIAASALPLHIGGNGVWGEWFNGTIDEVRVYNRALSSGEIQNDMVRSITPDTVAPTIIGENARSRRRGNQCRAAPQR